MEASLENFTSEKLFSSSALLDLEDLSEADFLGNVHFSENMEDLSNELFSSFFEDPLLAEKNPLLDMELDPPTPDIQAEHSYSLSGDSAPQSPISSIKMDDSDQESDNRMWTLGQDLSEILLKQESAQLMESAPKPVASSAAQTLSLAVLPRLIPSEDMMGEEMNPLPPVKVEPRETAQGLCISQEEQVQLPPTPPSSHSSDSDGSQSPRSMPPSSPVRSQARTSTAISSSPLLTAPHKLQGTSGPLMLTEEEKRTLIAEGYPVPNKLPLTKAEEKALKRVRRKIKNKISAQESRRKKKEYVECLEKKVETFTSENNELWKKVESLENANRTLLQQLQKLQSLVAGKVPRSCRMASTQTGTCIMVMLLCFVLVLGSFMPCTDFPLSQGSTSPSLSSADSYAASQIRSRSLLFFEEGTSLEDNFATFVAAEGADTWETKPQDSIRESVLSERQELATRHRTPVHEAAKYLRKTHIGMWGFNRSVPRVSGQQRVFQRDLTLESSAEYL
ncbi:cyclic AMP-responsive element-binding protein 3-like protein 1 [Polypterus senegalus]|uniref:cyclic AMP-responsive element-binding protein 3-like protein 1 n=1 Tax=Polypterus senegalus TaxID=55291 RepID=UPI0019629C15|nr:cyclic AMP-responsive element-binding protein 3-like protein 1 [Polypterus senegalus]